MKRPPVTRKQALRKLRIYVDQKATHWHKEYIAYRLGPVKDEEWMNYALGRADAFGELMHYLSLMNGFPWA